MRGDGWGSRDEQWFVPQWEDRQPQGKNEKGWGVGWEARGSEEGTGAAGDQRLDTRETGAHIILDRGRSSNVEPTQTYVEDEDREYILEGKGRNMRYRPRKYKKGRTTTTRHSE